MMDTTSIKIIKSILKEHDDIQNKNFQSFADALMVCYDPLYQEDVNSIIDFFSDHTQGRDLNKKRA